MYGKKDLFGILVIVKCECDKSCDVDEYFDYENCKCRKRIVDKLIEECTETVEEVKIAKITHLKTKTSINAVLAHCALCCFQYFLQLTLVLVLILFIFIGT